MAYWVHDFSSLLLLLSIYAAALNLVQLPLTSMIFQYAAPGERGKVYGLFQFTRGFSAFLFSLVIGLAVQFSSASDPVPLFADDIKEPYVFGRVLLEGERAIDRELALGLSPQTLTALQAGGSEVLLEARRGLAADLNAAIQGAAFDANQLFAGLELSRSAQRLQKRGLVTAGDRLIFNREVLHAAYPAFVSRNVDFRVGYKIDISIALAAFFVTLSTRRGKYAGA